VVGVLLIDPDLLPSACGNDAESGSATDTVTVQLDYQVRGDHAVFHLARKRAFSPTKASRSTASTSARDPPQR
jgi:hypothetical protein